MGKGAGVDTPSCVWDRFCPRVSSPGLEGLKAVSVWEGILHGGVAPDLPDSCQSSMAGRGWALGVGALWLWAFWEPHGKQAADASWEGPLGSQVMKCDTHKNLKIPQRKFQSVLCSVALWGAELAAGGLVPRAAAGEAAAAGLRQRQVGERKALAAAELGAALLAAVTGKFWNTHFRKFFTSRFWVLLWTAKKNLKLSYMSLFSLASLSPIIIGIRWGVPTWLG